MTISSLFEYVYFLRVSWFFNAKRETFRPLSSLQSSDIFRSSETIKYPLLRHEPGKCLGPDRITVCHGQLIQSEKHCEINIWEKHFSSTMFLCWDLFNSILLLGTHRSEWKNWLCLKRKARSSTRSAKWTKWIAAFQRNKANMIHYKHSSTAIASHSNLWRYPRTLNTSTDQLLKIPESKGSPPCCLWEPNSSGRSFMTPDSAQIMRASASSSLCGRGYTSTRKRVSPSRQNLSETKRPFADGKHSLSCTIPEEGLDSYGLPTNSKFATGGQRDAKMSSDANVLPAKKDIEDEDNISSSSSFFVTPLVMTALCGLMSLYLRAGYLYL